MQNLIPHKQMSSSRGSSPGPAPGPTPIEVLAFRQSPSDKKVTLIQPFNAPPDALPLYSIRISKSHKPNIILFQGDPSANNSIGEATFSSMSSKTKVSLRGHHFVLKKNDLTGNFTVVDDQRGNLKWHTDSLLGRALELRDPQGTTLAKIKTQGFPGSTQRKLEVYVPHDSGFLDLLVLTGSVAKAQEKSEMKQLMEVGEALVGV